MKKNNPLLIICLILFALPGFAEIANISDMPGTSSTHPKLVCFDNQVMLVWREEGGRTGTEKNIYYSLLTNGTWGDPGPAYATPVHSKNPALAIHENSIVLAWAEGNGANNRDIMTGIFQDKKWKGKPAKVLSSPYNSNWVDIVNAGGTLIAAWASAQTPGTPSDHWTIRLSWKNSSWNNTGRILSDNLNTPGKSLAMFPSLATHDGQVFAVWSERDHDGGRIMFAEGKSGFSTPVPITQKRTYAWPRIVVDSTGNLHVITTKTGGHLWYTTRIHGKWTPLVPVNTRTKHVRHFVALSVDQYDNLHAAYKAKDGLYYSMKPAGDDWKKEKLITSDTAYFPAIATDTHHANLTWSNCDEGQKGDIFYTRFDLPGTQPQPDQPLPPPTKPEPKPDPLPPQPQEPTEPPTPKQPTEPTQPPSRGGVFGYISSSFENAAMGYCVKYNEQGKLDLADVFIRFPIIVISRKLDIAFDVTSDERIGFTVGIHTKTVSFDFGPVWSLREWSSRPALLFGVNVPFN